MHRSEILGHWKSVAYTDMRGLFTPYDRQELTFNDNGTGNMHARTLFKRNTAIKWDFDGVDFYIHNLGGPGSIAVAAVEGNQLAVAENGMLMIYERR